MRSVIYPFKWGGADSLELRYSLRSVDKWMPDVQDVYLIGQMPNWYFGTHIPYEQDKKLSSVSNVLGKLRVACMDPRITEEFVYFNDDMFLLAPFQEGPWYMGNSPIRDGGIHHKGYTLTVDELDRRGVTKWKDCELHFPVVYEKTRCLELLNYIDIKLPYSFRTLYFNLQPKQLAPARDVKVFGWMEPKPGQWIHSCNNTTLDNGAFKVWLEKNYPKKSRWEA